MKRSKLLLMWLAGMLILLVSSCRSDDEECDTGRTGDRSGQGIFPVE